MVPMWFFPIAIACGNTVVLKPSEKDPSRRDLRSPRCGRRPACPTACFNVVTATRRPSTRCSTHPDVKAVSFVGSTPIAKYVYETGTAHGKRVQALGGAKNHMLVLPDADLDLAADAAVNAGFGSAGERCMAISALVAVEPIADELVAKITDRMGKLRTGDGTPRLRHGPAGHRAAPRQGRRPTSTPASTAGADARRRRPRRRGRRATATASSSARPCSTTSTRTCRVYTDEIFGPVLSVVRVAHLRRGRSS